MREGHGLSSQEVTCRQFAEREGFEVERVFTDDYSGGGDFWARPGLRALLDFLEEQDDKYAVIFDDIKRFARDTVFHLKLRQELTTRRAFPLCPTFRFDDTPEGAFVETVIAATAQLEREQNRRQVIRRMKARLEVGFWVFAPPIGYTYERQGSEKLLVPDAAVAEAVRAGLQGYSQGEFSTLTAVARFLDEQKVKTRWSRGSSLSVQRVERVLRNEIYAGWCVSPKWDIRVRGRHQALISESTFRQIQARLRIPAPAIPGNIDRPEFPLRGFVVCPSCERSYTGYWAQGRSARYSYYRCLGKRCVNIRTKQMETLFLDRLSDAVPCPRVFDLFRRVVLDEAGEGAQVEEARQKQIQKRRQELDAELARLVNLAASTRSPRARTLYEEKIEELSREEEGLEVSIKPRPEGGIEPVVEKFSALLENPVKYWRSGDLHDRRFVQHVAFEPPIPFDRETGYRTARFSPAFAVFERSRSMNSGLVDLIKQNFNRVAEQLLSWKRLLDSDEDASE